MSLLSRILIGILALGAQFAGAAKIGSAKYPFPIYQNEVPGNQVGGVRAAAGNKPIPARIAEKNFTLPEGFEMRLFAEEPAVVNPVTMTWDSRGRLWVLELYEYPLGAQPGEKPRDRIKILEDTDADGRADKVHVWADGLNLATGLLLGDGGAYVGQAPHMLFLKDTDGDDRADFRKPVMTGFGTEDRHELLNGFTWGPDGYLYMTHGVFTRSRVINPDDPDSEEVYMDAAVARWHPYSKKFEVFSDGTSNPWGVDFDYAGNAFISACVIDHMWHMAPGGQYLRQGGTWRNPYGYADMHSKRGGLPSIVDHRHHLSAYCGVQLYQGDQYPAEHLGTVLCGNIHDNAIHQDVLTPNGSSFKSSEKQDFVRANDGWFRPVSLQIGPDGALWVADWYDKYPCYQNARADPAGVDREYGRIWRVVHTGNKKGKAVASRPQKNMDLAKLSSAKLVNLLAHQNVWHREAAQRLLTERRDLSVRPALVKLATSRKAVTLRLAALWTLHTCGLLDENTLANLADDREFEIRTWVARLTGERAIGNDQTVERLERLASDANPSVRLAVATAARQFVSGHLTVNVPPPTTVDDDVNTGEILAKVIQASKSGDDPLIPFLVWMASEPLVVNDTEGVFDWLAENGSNAMPLAGHLTHKAMRRVCDLTGTDGLDDAVTFVAGLKSNSPLVVHALRGITAGLKDRSESPSANTEILIARLLKHPEKEVRELTQRLGAQWGNTAAIQKTLAAITNPKTALPQRIEAIRTVAKLKNKTARETLETTLSLKNETLNIEAMRGLAGFGMDELPEILLTHWSSFSLRTRIAATEVMGSRPRWASTMLSALEQRRIPRDDVSVTTVRSLLRQPWDFGMMAKRTEQVFGKVRATDGNRAQLIAQKKRMILTRKGKPDLKRGEELAKLICFTCHKLHEDGTDLEVGPNLTGAGRSSLDALLHNIIDPNQVIGAGYEMTEIETKDGQNFSGRIIEDSANRVRLLATGPREDIIEKAQIKSRKTSEISLMPEGLGDQLSDADLRDLVGYILNHPGDKQPFNWKNHGAVPAKPAAAKPAKKSAQIDWESVAHWNPDWHVVAPVFEGTPLKLGNFAGRKDVLRTHPYSREKASGLEREILVPAQGAKLNFFVAAHERGDWQLRVLANGKKILETKITPAGAWREIRIDLSRYAGKKVKLRLENAANGGSNEFGHWADVKIVATK
jgi:putative membrane-bound dehydrogenase-like protein